ncbi:hypothetical protein BGW39_010152 [Mortierella sp. 14UC]|nr:hypothetical protein BGW39_010152 [Mortierella sp. 14UC]
MVMTLTDSSTNCADDFHTDTDTFYQAFRAPDEQHPILIPIVLHPTHGHLYVLWSDIRDCFPQATRIQFQNVFVPKLKDSRLYRVKPHGIKYHPGIVLDVVYGKKPASHRKKKRSNGSLIACTNTAEHHADGATSAQNAVAEEADADMQDQDADIRDDKGDDIEGEGETKNDKQQDDILAKVESLLLQDNCQTGLDTTSVLAASFAEGLVTEEKEPESEAADDDGRDEVEQDAKEEGEFAQYEKKDEVEQGKIDMEEKQAEENNGVEKHVEMKGESLSSQEQPPCRAPHLKSESSQLTAPMDHARQEGQLTIEDLVKRRVQNILKQRFSLTEFNHSRFFFFLPILEDAPAITGAGSPNHADISIVTNPLRDIKFQLYYLCDCGDIPGFEGRWYPHWHTNDGESALSPTSNESFTLAKLEGILPAIGEYTMGVLEMLKYGVYVDKVPHAAHRVSLAIKFLQWKGIRSCEEFLVKMSSGSEGAVTESMLERLEPIAPLDWGARSDFENCLYRLSTRKHPGLYPCRASEGDCRRVCQEHLFSMIPQSAMEKASRFSEDPSSSESQFDFRRGTFDSRIKCMQRAREFFRLAAQMSLMPVFRVSLEWELSPEDEQEVAEAVCGLSAAELQLTVPAGTGVQDTVASGFMHGFEPLILAALNNHNIDEFDLYKRPSNAGQDLPQFLKRSSNNSSSILKSDSIIFSRGMRGDRMSAALSVRDMGRAISSVGRGARGLSRFCSLYVNMSDAPAFTLMFARPGGRASEFDPEEFSFGHGGLLSFFEKGQWRDKAICVPGRALDIKVSQLGYLTEVVMGVLFEQERVKLRDLVRLNAGLKSLELRCEDDDDPSSIFESVKAFILKHQRMEQFKIVKRQICQPRDESVFLWKSPWDPVKTRLEVSCYGEDKIQSMFQRYTSSIERLWVSELQPDEAAVLEKSLRSKKGPLALNHITIVDVHLMEPPVCDNLQRIILRYDIDEVVIEGTVDPDEVPVGSGQQVDEWDLPDGFDDGYALRYWQEQKAAAVEVWADFLLAVRSKVTKLVVRNDPLNRVFKALESRMKAGSLDMPRLRSLNLASDMEAGLFADRWLEALLRSKQEAAKDSVLPGMETPSTTTSTLAATAAKTIPATIPTKGAQAITEVVMLRVKIDHEEWVRLLGYLDFARMVKFRVVQSNAFRVETLALIVDVFLESGTILKVFHAECGMEVDKEACAVVKEKFRTAEIGKDQSVDISGYFTQYQSAFETYFQAFRAPDEQESILIPVVRHPTLKELYVLWSDITTCFPRATRVQYSNIFVPMLRDARLYRVKPHGIRYHPDIVLDVIYGEWVPRKTNKHKKRGVIRETVASETIHTVKGSEGDTIGGEGSDIQDFSDGVSVATHSGADDTLSLGGDDILGGSDSTVQDQLTEEHSVQALAQENDNPHNSGFTGGDIRTTGSNGAIGEAGVEVEAEAEPETEVEAEVEVEQPALTRYHPAAIQQPTLMNKELEQEPGHPLIILSEKDGMPDPTTISEPTATMSTATDSTATVPTKTAQAAAASTVIAPTAVAPLTTMSVQEGYLRIADVVANRVKNIVNVRSSWWNSYPRYFCFLPVLTASTGTTASLAETGDKLSFQLCNFCDCGDDPGQKDPSHWTCNSRTDIPQEQLTSIIPLVGEFVVAVLEMIKYKAIAGDVVGVFPEAISDIQRRLSLSIQFFESKGVPSCERYIRDTLAGSSPGELTSVALPSQEQVHDFWRIVKRRSWMSHEMMPHRISESLIGWMCMLHWFPASGADTVKLLGELMDRTTKDIEYATETGAVISSIGNMKRAREVFRLVKALTITTIFRVSLQWDLTPEDEQEIAKEIDRVSVAAIHITVQRGSPVQDPSNTGLGYGMVSLVTAALRNPKIEAFVLLAPTSEERHKNYISDERSYIVSSFESPPAGMVALISRRTGQDERVKAIMRVSDGAIAVKSIRRIAQGFHKFSQLELTRDCVDMDITITFAAPGAGKPGCNIEDTDYNSRDIVPFFERRQWCDEIKCDFDVIQDGAYLRLKCLTRLNMIFTLAQDRARVREIIKMNKNLKTLLLYNVVHDDPSQIFEAFKSLLFNHPSIEMLRVEHGHYRMAPSMFTWTNPSDPAKMRVEMTCHGGDRLQAMFQRYAPQIEGLTLERPRPEDIAVLEKSSRLKKGPMALRRMAILWVNQMEESVRSDLKTIILRRDIGEVVVVGSAAAPTPDTRGSESRLGGSRSKNGIKSNIDNRNKASGSSIIPPSTTCTIMADFVLAVRSKITMLTMCDGSHCKLFEELEHIEESLDMPRLISISLAGEWDTTMFGCAWFEKLLRSKRPSLSAASSSGAILGPTSAIQLDKLARTSAITAFHLAQVAILPEEWDRLISYLDFSQMVNFDVFQTNAFNLRTLFKLADAIPVDCGRLAKFTVHDGRISKEHAYKALFERFRGKRIGKNVRILVRGMRFY